MVIHTLESRYIHLKIGLPANETAGRGLEGGYPKFGNCNGRLTMLLVSFLV